MKDYGFMKRITKITVRRSMIMLFAFLLMASAIIGELFKLQVLGYDEYYNEVFDQLTDLVPNTGISLPFFSYGGSSLVILLLEMGILLSISKMSRRQG